jgi:hypothetical protein
MRGSNSRALRTRLEGFQGVFLKQFIEVNSEVKITLAFLNSKFSKKSH